MPDTDETTPDKPTELTKRSWTYVARTTFREFRDDQCTDLAAALTYYAVLAIGPAAIALLSILGLVSNGPKTVDTILQVLRQIGASGAATTLDPMLHSLASQQSSGIGLLVGELLREAAQDRRAWVHRAVERVAEAVERLLRLEPRADALRDAGG